MTGSATRITQGNVAYWVCTGLVVFFIGSGGLAYALQVPDVVQGVVALGFPLHFIVLLGVWKVLGAIAILVPGLPLIKEWAYAGDRVRPDRRGIRHGRDRRRVVARRRPAVDRGAGRGVVGAAAGQPPAPVTALGLVCGLDRNRMACLTASWVRREQLAPLRSNRHRAGRNHRRLGPRPHAPARPHLAHARCRAASEPSTPRLPGDTGRAAALSRKSVAHLARIAPPQEDFSLLP